MTASTLQLIAIGCGQVFERYHLPAIRFWPAVRLVGVCDVDANRRTWAQEAVPECRFASSIDGLLRSVEADAALISSPPETHAALAESVLHANLALLVEKPMTVTLDEARRITELQQRRGGVFRVGFNRRYRRDYSRVRARTAGHVEHVAYTFVADARRWTVHATTVTPRFVMHDAGSHAVDLVAHVGGAPIVRIRAQGASVGGEYTVTLEAVLKNGVSAACTIGHGSRYRERLMVTARKRVHRASEPASPMKQAKLAFHKITGRPTPNQESFRAQLAGFVSACRAKPDDIGADAADGLASASAIDAALRSLENGGAWHDVATWTPRSRP